MLEDIVFSHPIIWFASLICGGYVIFYIGSIFWGMIEMHTEDKRRKEKQELEELQNRVNELEDKLMDDSN